VPNPDYRAVLFDAVHTYFRLDGNEKREEQQLLQSGEYGEAGREMMTVLEKREEKGRRLGLKEGEQKGEEKGERKALQNALLLFLSTRFERLPESLEKQVRRVKEVDRLNTLIQQACQAESAEEIARLLEN